MMKHRPLTLFVGLAVVGAVVIGVAGCESAAVAVEQTAGQEATLTDPGALADSAIADDFAEDSAATIADADLDTSSASLVAANEGSFLELADMFTARDLTQSAHLEGADSITVQSETDVAIGEEGVYVLTGDATNVTVQVDAGDEAKVQLVLDGVSIANASSPVISVVTADKVFVTLTDSDNYLEVSGTYGSDSLDAVIFSKSDLVLNGTGSLKVISKAGNGITSKDDLKVTGGTYYVDAAIDGIEANDSIRIFDGELTIVSGKDAFHSENSDDLSLGYIYIADVTLTISAGDDGIQGNAVVQIDGGAIDIQTCTEGIEGTYVQINGGDLAIYATDDGINAARKSDYDVVLEVNGGTIDINMAGGDTDAFDSNGDLYINGGTINVTANSAFDYMGVGRLTGGQVTVNGVVMTEFTPSQMGGMGGRGARPGR